ncbi:MAG: YeeE/YedE thiosulfate transporter family protein [Candidatus Bipolaricaulota bacterium]|nr:YeeE/YedE family protein [Candidatus Bipolaricaulota bacterium]MDW8031613.1 YeeE/YedE thiosulfate transporter family protein [Candidatus Bipolaricaulota bacterium]MDW8329264.1 YeeE/YedE thiosulfate transporter family protein [Candidatus Bipolaricaulota bacterium]
MATRELTVQTQTSWWSRLPGWLKWGAVIGLVQIFAIVAYGPLGVSTAYPRLVGVVLDKIFPGFAQEQLYLREIGAKIGWEVMIVFGLFVGALLSSALSRWRGRAQALVVAPVEVKGFTDGRLRRYVRAFLGGFLFIFGARLAGGCTTGHILSGFTQMAVSGLVFAVAAFGAGMLTAKLLFREPAREV